MEVAPAEQPDGLDASDLGTFRRDVFGKNVIGIGRYYLPILFCERIKDCLATVQ